MVSAKARVCAVIGDPVEHSLSPALHNAAFSAAGLDYAYVAFRVRGADLGPAMEGVRALGIHGLSVTIPHKVAIIRYLDELDEVARRIGAINTVVNDGGHLKGYTTDGHGALAALETRGEEVQDRKVLIIGSGGAARAIGFTMAMERRPARITILGIIPDELEDLGRDLADRTCARVDWGMMDRLEGAVRDSDVIVHCTPVGMAPDIDGCVLPEGLLEPRHVVFDIVYTPLRTRLLERAEQAGAKAIPGLDMFVHQAARQFALWTDEPPPVDVMDRVVRAALEDGDPGRGGAPGTSPHGAAG